ANIQVLPGPQALFFGKNASGGVISFASADPTDSFESFAKAGYEFEARQRYVEGAVSGPLSDVLRSRLAFRYDESSGWLKNRAGPIANPYELDPDMRVSPGAYERRLGGATTLAGRLTLEFEPTANLSARLKSTLTDLETDHLGGTVEIMACSPGQTRPHTFDIIDIYGDCKINGRTSIGSMNPVLAQHFPRSEGGVGYVKGENQLHSLKIEYDAGPLTVTSVTGYYKMKVQGLGNHSYAAVDYFPGGNSAN